MGKENADLICALMASRGQLLRQLKDLRVDTVRTRPEPNEWSVQEILNHMADVDALYMGRVSDILAGKEQMRGMNLADWEAERTAAEEGGLVGVLRRMQSSHAQALENISNIGKADLQKSARHPARDEVMTVRQVLEGLVRHDLAHADQIAKTRAVVEAA